MLWFDVGNERYTTLQQITKTQATLWFDVGNERYTTLAILSLIISRLWFDVGNERYTTRRRGRRRKNHCGLM